MKRKLALLLVMALVTMSLFACGSGDNDPAKTNDAAGGEVTTSGETEDKVWFVRDGVSDYVVVRSESASPDVVTNAALVYRTIGEVTGATLKIQSDWVKKGQTADQHANEILIGKTEREASVELLGSVEDYTFTIRVVKNQLLILGANDVMLLRAIEYFNDVIMKDPNYAGEGYLALPADFSYVSEPTPATFRNLLDASDTFTTKCRIYSTFSPVGDDRIVQGGCTDGSYFYQAVINSKVEPNTAVIQKIDIATKKVVKVSASLNLDHCNDLAYNAKTGQLLICHCMNASDRISFMDPETLELTGHVDVGQAFYALGYSEERDQYVIAWNGGASIGILDNNFKLVKTLNVAATGNTTQGLECDGQYIYFVQYKENVLLVYDWSGRLISNMPLKNGGIEPENIMIVGDTIYVGCNNSNWTGGQIVTVEIRKVTE